ncbi:hypothetical protein PV682_15115 [Streptomyces niveiscabiei]|uniref:hypothetical protein n=1 Tax=Streptomyces niveiscabiei TaxID=164115 RepID=UPI0029B041AB|nr:hypothetical protein [Streptomyces niveiscabiei]MDX3382789.1 hypothetical protein [Streptomyces niveiscabiei]
MALTSVTRSTRTTRTTVSAAFVALACLLVPLATLAAWASYDLRDQERYVRALAPLATDAAVRRTIVEGVARDAPGVPRRVVEDEVRRFTATAAYRAAWDEGNREAYTAVMRALEEPGREVVAGVTGLEPAGVAPAREVVGVVPGREGAVTAPGGVSAREVGGVRSGGTSGRQLAVGNGSFASSPVTLLPRQNLDALRRGYHVLDVAGFWLPVAAVVFAGAGIAVAGCRRRALTATALGTALGGALLGLAVAVARHLTLDGLTDPAHRLAAAAVYDALTETLRTASWLLLAGGLVVAGATWVTRVVRTRV